MLIGDDFIAIKQDGFDPQLAANLRHLGAVHPLPTVSYTSTAASSELTSNMEIRPLSYGPSSNPAIRLLEAREVLAQRAEQELSDVGRKGFKGREFADVITLKKIIALRDESSKSPKQIERQLGLKSGVVEKLGSKGLVGAL
ncbi:MAG: hypothetical protein M1814_000303 [Vezdaea aestivalis]|nr:MAG: hypothetical protein M1814_000303 [Vezdaea aestivalis]